MAKRLPDFVPPMLAGRAEPFDSDEYLFEVKWDGLRAQAAIEDGTLRLTNRNQRDMTARYPEFAPLCELGSGILIDGEVIVIEDGRPRFDLVMKREHSTNPMRIAQLRRSLPATFVAFDLLYRDGRSVMTAPLAERRDQLAELLEDLDSPTIVVSSGVVGTGLEYFEAAVAQELEGIVAKRLASKYDPGRRTGDWLKIKRTQHMQCAVLGFTGADRDVRSLIIAGQAVDPGTGEPGPLQCVGKVGSGLTDAMRERLAGLFRGRRRESPWLPCEIEGLFVEPGLYCTVSYLELTRAGHLRAPVFLDLIVDDQTVDDP